jgi:RNA polymerase sigma-70 factor (ECF subfamily)
MGQQSLSVVVRHLHRLVSRGEMADVSDAQLLERFVGERQEAAFLALLNRHGAMVFGVCQRILTQT